MKSNPLGALAFVMGLLIVLPRWSRRLWTLQLALNEFAWVGVLLGLFSRSAFGMVGAALSAVQLSRRHHARRDMDAMLQEALGTDYEQAIPVEALRRAAPSRWTGFFAGAELPPPEVKYDVPYVQTPTRTLKLDVYRPTIPPVTGDSYPAIISVHGGSWRSGDKRAYFEAHHRALAAQGYYVFDIQYRLTELDNIQWPTMMDDVRAAIRWVKTKAPLYEIDPERLVLFGRSAGGHLALQAAYRADGEHADTAVKAVVAVYAPTNLRLTGQTHSPAVLTLLGGASYEVPERYADASPLDFAGEHSPPTLLLHGYMDTLVSPGHSELLLNRLRAVNVPCALLRVPWGRHGFDALRGGMGYQLTQYYLDRFLAWVCYHD